MSTDPPNEMESVVRSALDRAGAPCEQKGAFADWAASDGLEADTWRSLLREVDESAFGLVDWVAAALLVRDEVAGKDRPVPSLRSVFGYVGCCCAMEKNGAIAIDLREHVAEVLESYGFAGEED